MPSRGANAPRNGSASLRLFGIAAVWPRSRPCAAASPILAARAVLADLPAQEGVDEHGDFPVHHRLDVARLRLPAVVLHQAVRVEHVGADLVAPGNVRLLAARLRKLLALLLQLALGQLRPQHRHRPLAALDLRPRAVALEYDARRDVGDALRRFGLVRLLAAGAA